MNIGTPYIILASVSQSIIKKIHQMFHLLETHLALLSPPPQSTQVSGKWENSL